MEIKERLAELNKLQAKALADYYNGRKMVERAETQIQTISIQIQALASQTEPVDVPAE